MVSISLAPNPTKTTKHLSNLHCQDPTQVEVSELSDGNKTDQASRWSFYMYSFALVCV